MTTDVLLRVDPRAVTISRLLRVAGVDENFVHLIADVALGLLPCATPWMMDGLALRLCGDGALWLVPDTVSAAAFVRAKIHVLPSTASDDWTVTAHQAEVLLPPGTDDRFCCPRTLFKAVDAEHPDDGKALPTYITLTWRPERLHAQWEMYRRLALELVRDHQVAILAVQHDPGKVASSNDPSIHLAVAGPRVLGSLGLGSYVPR